MLFNSDLMFIHVPKTGGMSTTRFLLDVLPEPLYYSSPHHDLESFCKPSVIKVPGIRHETLQEASAIVESHGFAVEKFPAILAAIRNPYEIEVSRFAYLQHPEPWKRGVNRQLAADGDFEAFAINSSLHASDARPLESFFLLNGEMPANMRVVRHESLEEGVRSVLRDIGVESADDFPSVNRSKHGHFALYYTPAAEEAVYKKYRWAFDSGFYDRLDLSEVSAAQLIDSAIKEVIPQHAKVLVVSEGDDALLRLNGHKGLNFPQTEGEQYSRYRPSDSAEAIELLKTSRAKGGQYLLFPNTAFWWLEYYREFQEHLDTRYKRVWDDKSCVIYELWKRKS